MKNALALALALALVVAGLAPAPAAAQGGCPPVTPSAAWKSSVGYPDDPFRHDGGAFGEPGWLKFTVLTCDTSTVYFQNGNQHLFHYDFATSALDPFVGLSLEQFEALTLYEAGREAVLGAVVLPSLGGFPPAPEFDELGIQLIGEDPLDPQLVVDVFTSVRAAIAAGPEVQAFYFPTFEQQGPAAGDAAFLAQNGIQISSPARWSTANACYSQGWAVGRLRYVPAAEVEDAFLAGTLRPDDILLTDGVPSDLPLLAGIVSLAPSTPNSHVAILAGTFGVPFAYLGDPEDVARAQELVGRRVALRAYDQTTGLVGVCAVSLIDAEDVAASLVADILVLKLPPPLSIPAVTPLGGLYASTDSMVQSDIRYFGGKAANFGILRRSIPNDSPVSLGISFDLWEEFLDQTMASGNTLREDIALVLAPYGYPPVDFQAFDDDMKAIRDLIEDDTVFTPAQEAAIVAMLQDPQFGFDPTAKIRFRSSTNVEDSERFTGAGLYDSKSGCLLDDLDGDADGPSLCEPDEPDERGVLRAIRKVFGSFYDANAVLERLRHGVDESEVGMAILVHHSFPDPLEEANGVATVDRTGPITTVSLVTQLGAESVTNPDGTSIPEEVRVTIFGSSQSPSLVTSSSLVQLGDTVLEYPNEYLALTDLLLAAADRFELESGKTSYVLDYEYKRMAPGGAVKPAGGLVVKQLRELPQPDTTPSITPYLLDDPGRFVVLQGSGGSVFAAHRLKSSWHLRTKDMLLSDANLATRSLLEEAVVVYDGGCSERVMGGPPASLPGFAHAFDLPSRTASDSFRPEVSIHPRTWTLSLSGVGAPVSEAQSPLVTLDDLTGFGAPLRLRADYDQPVPIVDGAGMLASTSTEQVSLVPEELVAGEQNLRTHVFTGPGGVEVRTRYWLAPFPGQFCAGCIQPLARFVSTTITGLTTDPIVLRDPLAMSYEAGQHNFTEQFLFEPQLDPRTTAAQLFELRTANVGSIHVAKDLINSATVTLLPVVPCTPPPDEPYFRAPGFGLDQPAGAKR